LLAASFGIQPSLLDSEAAIDALFAEADLENAINQIEIPLDKDAFPRYLSAR
jgi:acetolactate synthase-1/2/3 large subunit